MDCSTPSLPVHHQLLEFTHAHLISDAIQPSHPLSSPSPLTFNLSQHQGLFKWVNSLHHVAKVLEFQLQHQSFQWILRTDFIEHGLIESPCSPRDSRESSPTPQFKSINSSALSSLYNPTLTLSIYKMYSYRAFILRKFLQPPFSSGVHFYTLSINLIYIFLKQLKHSDHIF